MSLAEGFWVAGIDHILGSSMRNQLISMQRTQTSMDSVQLRLASGRKVNSAIDNPQNFFAARALNYRASDLLRQLDAIDQNIKAIQTADNALTAIGHVLDQVDSVVSEKLIDLTRKGTSLNEIILGDGPDGYWRLNETTGNTAENLGSGGTAIDGTYHNTIQKGSDPFYIGEGNDVTSTFPGGTANNRRVSIPDSNLINLATYNERTVELVFNAENTTTRQVLYEEGGTTNAFAIYIDNGRLYVTGRDQGAWGPADIHVDIEEGKTYHAAFVFDFPDRTFTGYLNGEEIGQVSVNAIFPAHSADIGIGGTAGGTYFHDGPYNGDDLTFQGRIAEVALYNKVLTQDDLAKRFEATRIGESNTAEDELDALLAQLDLIALDASYRGVNLLNGDEMTTFFNEDRSSSLITEGDIFSSAGLGISAGPHFYSVEDIESLIDEIREAKETVRAFGRALATDFAILSTRKTLINGMVTELQAGSDELTLADQNEEGSKMLALQTRQQLQTSMLSFAANSSLSILKLFA